ncbi:CAP domain-containing protein [Paracoccus tibetensis]|uniref:Uncharacterized conserved protein YkwD, contains CAP (CSP/antigen 5/PR1) domain n=1 Tax=Paracoccus tibetensis TaxID=336292 RepID=A0A1G5IPC3_9RHOB|nr:CAP domain-containing protein [Paracoccus tibetensis]SCY77774.1 Uncharacterized conserved protein YkwD, contains CAP (CSP/antigen 5/PR1) domain [Paracoccus tibetensis]
MNKLVPALLMLSSALLLAACGTPPATSGAEDPYAVQVGTAGTATCPTTTAQENSVGAAATNQARRQAGLPPVQPSPRLALVAARHACDMAQRGRMTHIGSTTTGPAARVRAAGYQPRITAENIAAGPFSQTRVLGEWTGSQGHLKNILLPQVSEFGIGQAIAEDGRTRYWTAIYAAPK